MSASAEAAQRLLVGRIVGAYGVQGWVKIRSFTHPRENILRYGPWRLEHHGSQRDYAVLAGRIQGGFVVARLEGIGVREAAMALAGASITVARECLPPLGEGEYYWTDLIGLRVVNSQGVELGRVTRLFETGANDVLVVNDGARERLIPYVLGMYVLEIDLAAGLMRVDWDADF